MLQQNLTTHCGNINTYSRNKEVKMKLIIGKHLIEQDNTAPKSFEELSVFLNEFGIAQETLECALIYLLRLSGNYLEVS